MTIHVSIRKQTLGGVYLDIEQEFQTIFLCHRNRKRITRMNPGTGMSVSLNIMPNVATVIPSFETTQGAKLSAAQIVAFYDRQMIRVALDQISSAAITRTQGGMTISTPPDIRTVYDALLKAADRSSILLGHWAGDAASRELKLREHFAKGKKKP